MKWPFVLIHLLYMPLSHITLALASSLDNLHNEAMTVPKDGSRLVQALQAAGLTENDYTLQRSFLTDTDIDLLLMKALHEPKTQQQLANDIFLCSTQAIAERLNALRDGLRIGDMTITLNPARGGKLQTTVHPVMLPLNLSEAYVLLQALGTRANELSPSDPHAAILQDLSAMIHGQLSDYACKKIDERLAEQGIHFHDEVRPEFIGDTREEATSGPSASPSRQSHSRIINGHPQHSINWLYLEKSGETVQVLCQDESGSEQTITGRIAHLHSESILKDPGTCMLAPEGTALNHCLGIEGDGGAVTILCWDQVIDIRLAQ